MGLFSELGSFALNTLRNANNTAEQAYAEGRRMKDEQLLRYFKNSTGSRKIGYAKAIKERWSDYEIKEFRRQGLI